ncbi:MAG: DUF1566 domain-containing protein [Rhodoferax sp.]|nr:DUF1566 domain-containing protein [Rhodoferax sp.]
MDVALLELARLIQRSPWYLPNKYELEEILKSSGTPAIDADWFPNTLAGRYWTSSPYDNVLSGTLYVNFAFYYEVSAGYRNFKYAVRLVRPGQ